VRRAIFFAVGIILTCADCSLFVDLSGLDESGDAGAFDAATEAASGTDAAATDAGVSPLDAGDASASGPIFLDDFDRADSSTIGNGWIAKQPAFVIGGDMLVRDDFGNLNYVDNILYRPAAENILDVRATVELSYASVSDAEYPQLHIRVQTGSVTTPGTLDSYDFFPNGGVGSGNMIISRQHGGSSSTGSILCGFSMSAAFDTTHRFRFSLSAKGTTSIALSGTVETLMGATWQSLGSTSCMDTDPTKIDQPGSVGVSGANQGEQTGDFSYDNFTLYAL
jgi:hypothetical protein